MNTRDFFQYLSYLQYPLLLIALGYAGWSAVEMGQHGISSSGPLLDRLNYALLFAGVGIGLSSLQDPTKTQNKASLRVWQDPRKGRWALWLLSLEAFIPIVLGLIGALLSKTTAINQLSLGLVAFGLGMIGLLKTAIEMRENFRSDRHPAISEVIQ